MEAAAPTASDMRKTTADKSMSRHRVEPCDVLESVPAHCALVKRSLESRGKGRPKALSCSPQLSVKVELPQYVLSPGAGMTEQEAGDKSVSAHSQSR